MRKYVILSALFALFVCSLSAQVNNIYSNAGIATTVGAPTFRPGAKGSIVAIDTVSGTWYVCRDRYSVNWLSMGDRIESISGCSAPAYTPNKYNSELVINNCAVPELYHHSGGGVWVCLNCVSGATYTAGTGIAISGSNVISNTAPDQTVTIAGAGGNVVTGTYPNFTVTGTPATGAETIVTAGTAISVTGAGTAGSPYVVTNTAPNVVQNLSLAGQALSISGGTGATLPIVGVSAGTGISVNTVAGVATVTNTGITALSSGNATTASGSAVDWGGTTTGNVTVTGNGTHAISWLNLGGFSSNSKTPYVLTQNYQRFLHATGSTSGFAGDTLYNFFAGYLAGQTFGVASTGYANTIVGTKAGMMLDGSGGTLARSNSLFGSGSGQAMTTASFNTAVGVRTLSGVTTSDGSTAIGYHALTANTAAGNTAFGREAATATTTGIVLAIGYQALFKNTIGSRNAAVGETSMRENITGVDNTAIGYQSGYNVTANENTFIGSFAGKGITSSSTGSFNTGIGMESLKVITTAAQNTAIGRTSLTSCNTCTENVAIGLAAGSAMTGGDRNIIFGRGAGGAFPTNGDDNIIIGYSVSPASDLSNVMMLGRAIYATTQNSLASSLVGIGTITPARKLSVETPDAVTNAVTYTQRNTHTTSGAAAVGFGDGAETELENASGTNRVAQTQETIWSDATNATEDATYTLKLIKAGTLTAAQTTLSTGETTFAGDVTVPDEAYAAGWDASLEVPTKNAVYDKIQALNVTAGTYTPTLNNVTNATSSTAKNCQYSRNGNIVTVFGSVDVTTTLAVSTEVGISLPIASALAAATDLNGTANASSAIASNAYTEADATNDRASLKFIGLSVGGAGTLFFSFSYTVL